MNINELMKQKWFIPAVVVGGLVIVGAVMRGSGNRVGNMDYGDGQVKVKTDEGEWATGGDVPKDWPSDVPVYSGAQVLYSASSNPSTGTAGSYLALSTSDEVEKVADYYKRVLVEKGWTIASTAKLSGGVYVTATKGDMNLSLTVTPAEGGSAVLIGVAKE